MNHSEVILSLNPEVKQNKFEDTFKAADVHLYHAPVFTPLSKGAAYRRVSKLLIQI